MKLIAKTLEGLEDVLAEEIRLIGGRNIQKITRAVMFEGDEKIMYTSNYMLRTALRILEVKKEFEARDADELYRVLFKIPWDQLISVNNTFAVDATTSGEVFTHSKFTALKTKDAIVDKIRARKGSRPNVNVLTPTYRINVHVRDTTVTLSLDTSGDSLHMRGYRVTAVEAPLNEAMAAGLVLLSEWDTKSPLLDPMCGSGTILIEAYRIANNIPPQKDVRLFGFKKWKKFNKELWEEVVRECDANINYKKVSIKGSDKNLRALRVTEQNIQEAGIPEGIEVSKKDFFKYESISNTTIITNPPYDVRLKEQDIEKFYARMGDKFKQDCVDCKAWIFSGNIEAIKAVGLKPSQKYNLLSGGLPARFYKYDIYEGSKS